jgi:hypothetical protein
VQTHVRLGGEGKAFEMAAVDKFSEARVEVVPGFTFLDSDTSRRWWATSSHLCPFRLARHVCL